MSKLAILFWVICIAVIGWGGFALVAYGVSSSYHPMAAKGDLLLPLRMLTVVFAVLVGIIMLVLWTRRRPLSRQTYVTGLVLLAVIAVLPVLPRIDSGYEHTVYVGGQRHDIPWQYDPSGYQDSARGTSIRIRAALPDLEQSYRSLSATVSIGKSTDFNFGRGGDAPTEVCEVGPHTTVCQWRQGEFVYRLSGDNDNLQEVTNELRTKVVTLMDGFIVTPD